MRFLVLLLAISAFGQKYTGPVPEKEDLPYLVHADNLTATEAVEAKEEKGKKDEITYSVPGPASSAKTPLASPILIVKAKSLDTGKLQLYKFDVKNGRREITFRSSKRAKNPEPFHLNIVRIGEGLYRIEVSDSLPNGEYSLSPAESNQTFCFEVY